MTKFTSFNKKTSKSWLIPMIFIKKLLKIQQNPNYLPIQKSLKMQPKITSTSTFPTILPRLT